MGRGSRDWSEKDLRKHLVEARKLMWRESTISRIAELTGLQEGMTTVDAGCGLGYLGWTFRPHFGVNGTYLGLDCSEKLLAEASEAADEWTDGATARFINCSVYDIPLPDSCSGLTMCQTLLMHLERPERALEEMVRITRPGGAVMCMEPDNISAMFSIPWGSEPGLSDSELISRFRVFLKWYRGRKALGRGDWAIGKKLPKLLYDAGLSRVDVVFNDKPWFINPPYETEFQRYRMSLFRERLQKDDDTEQEEWSRNREWRENYLAGGGSSSTYYRFRRAMRQRWAELKPLMREQIDDGSFYSGLAPSSFYCVFGFRQD